MKYIEQIGLKYISKEELVSKIEYLYNLLESDRYSYQGLILDRDNKIESLINEKVKYKDLYEQTKKELTQLQDSSFCHGMIKKLSEQLNDAFIQIEKLETQINSLRINATNPNSRIKNLLSYGFWIEKDIKDEVGYLRFRNSYTANSGSVRLGDFSNVDSVDNLEIIHTNSLLEIKDKATGDILFNIYIIPKGIDNYFNDFLVSPVEGLTVERHQTLVFKMNAPTKINSLFFKTGARKVFVDTIPDGFGAADFIYGVDTAKNKITIYDKSSNGQFLSYSIDRTTYEVKTEV